MIGHELRAQGYNMTLGGGTNLTGELAMDERLSTWEKIQSLRERL